MWSLLKADLQKDSNGANAKFPQPGEIFIILEKQISVRETPYFPHLGHCPYGADPPKKNKKNNKIFLGVTLAVKHF